MEYLLILLIVLAMIILFVINFLSMKPDENNKEWNTYTQSIYYKKLFFLRKSELKFLKTISVLEKEYNVVPKLNLKTIIKASNKKYKKNLNITVDYAIFNKDYSDILLLIELTDVVSEPNNQEKVDKIQKICDEVGIKFITFYSDKIDQESIISQIEEVIKIYMN